MAAVETPSVPQSYPEAFVALDGAICDLPHHGVPRGVECNLIDLSNAARKLTEKKGIPFPEAMVAIGISNLHRICDSCIIRKWVQESQDEISSKTVI